MTTYSNKYNAVCNNCLKYGHLFRNCKVPITSFGVVQFRITNNTRQYLMICRKHSLGYIDFLRGKYSVHDKHYIMNMIKQMSNQEKKQISEEPFETLWNGLWQNNDINSYKQELENSKTKFQYLKNKMIDIDGNNISELFSLINESNEFQKWDEPEWGFPKGRRNFLEKDFQCALREMTEETGYTVNDMMNIKNILPFEEVFIGSNYKTYKHKYYLMYMEYENTLSKNNIDNYEVSSMEWKTYDECISLIRPYNTEKKRLISRIDNTLKAFFIIP